MSTGADHAAVVEMMRYSPVVDELAQRFADARHRL